MDSGVENLGMELLSNHIFVWPAVETALVTVLVLQ
jgi:hypothetical protein